MLLRIYIEALLTNEALADDVWEQWDRGALSDGLACIAWLLIICKAA
jgi:hypothetical protein